MSSLAYGWLILCTARNPYRLADGRDNLAGTGLRFLAIQTFLIASGYVVSFQATMNLALWFMVVIYAVYLILAGIVLVVLRKLPADAEGTVPDNGSGDHAREHA